jgi:primosomal protein N' (replication factor Y) (superfamily II helicase)
VRQESPARREPPYPPAIRLANVIFSGSSEQATAQLALDAAEWLRTLLSSQAISEITLVGPAPCPVDRIKKRWRWHLLLKSQRASALSKVGRYFLERFAVPSSHALRVAFDRDPVSLL